MAASFSIFRALSSYKILNRLSNNCPQTLTKWSEVSSVPIRNYSAQPKAGKPKAEKPLPDKEKSHQEMVIRKKTYYKAKYGGRYTVTMLPGHGIGPEMMAYVKEVFRYCGAPIDFEEINMDAERDDMDEVHMAITSIKRNGVAIKGNVETKVNRPNFRSRNVEMRQKLKLFAYVMHTKSFPGIITRHQDLDIITIRQNTEGEYAMLEHEAIPERGDLDINQMRSTDKNKGGVVESLKICTLENSKQLARYAFEYARKYNRKKVTAIHKANIMKLSDGLFLAKASEVAKEYPDIQYDNMIIDNCCMQLVSNPQQFDVMVTSNLYGNIIGNLVCGLVGGAGLCSGRNYGERYAVFEPGTRNTGSSIVGQNIANPVAMLNAAADLLDHLDLHYHGSIIREAISQTINVDKIHTPDLGGTASSSDIVQNIVKIIHAQSIKWYSPQALSVENKKVFDKFKAKIAKE